MAILLDTVVLPILTELREKFPRSLLELKNIPGLGVNRIKILAELLNVRKREDLKQAVEAGALAKLRGFSPKLQERLQKSLAIDMVASNQTVRRASYNDAAQIASGLLSYVSRCAKVERAEIVGSFRRKTDTVGNLNLIAASSEPDFVRRHFLTSPSIAHEPGSSSAEATAIVTGGLRVKLRVVTPESWGAALVWFTGSKSHCFELQTIANTYGLRLDESGLFRGGVSISTTDKEDVYRALGLFWIPPELREATSRDRRRGPSIPRVDRTRGFARRPPFTFHVDRWTGINPTDGP